MPSAPPGAYARSARDALALRLGPEDEGLVEPTSLRQRLETDAEHRPRSSLTTLMTGGPVGPATDASRVEH